MNDVEVLRIAHETHTADAHEAGKDVFLYGGVALAAYFMEKLAKGVPAMETVDMVVTMGSAAMSGKSGMRWKSHRDQAALIGDTIADLKDRTWKQAPDSRKAE
jgi:hypothetical protein